MCKKISLYKKILIEKELDAMIKDVDVVLLQKNDKSYNKLLKKLTGVLINTFDAQSEKALKDIIKYLTEVGEDGFTKETKKEITSMLKENLGKNISALVKDSFFDLTEKIYSLGIKEVGASAKMKLSFDVNDVESAAILGKQNLFFVANYYDDKLASEFKEVLDGYFDGEKTLEEIADDFEVRFEEKIGKGRTYYENLAHTTTNRVRNLGAVTGFEKADVSEYEVVPVIDDRTSEICEGMEGKVFPVARAIKMRDEILSMDDPQDIKTISPWRKLTDIEGVKSVEDLKSMKAEDLPAGMELPPYHGGPCRTIILMRFTDGSSSRAA